MRAWGWWAAALVALGCSGGDEDAPSGADAGPTVDAAAAGCAVGATDEVPCGRDDEGVQQRICVAGAWVDTGECVEPALCLEGTLEQEDCGAGASGVRERRCEGGEWAPWGPCNGEQVCADGAVQEEPCSIGAGLRQRTCAEGKWGEWGRCFDPEAMCEPDEVDELECGLNLRGISRRTCVEARWSEPSPCADPDECRDDLLQEEACGDHGQRRRVCVRGRFDAWGACEVPPVCNDGDAAQEACGARDSGVRRRTCGGGAWGPWGDCEGACRDACEAGATRCEAGARAQCGPAADSPCLAWLPPEPCAFGCAGGQCAEPPPPVIINEVYFDAVGADPPEVFVELWGPAGAALDGLRLVGINGSGGASYQPVALRGAIAADGYFLVAHLNARPELAALADQLERNVDYQNGPDSVRLVRGDLVLDAVGYGDFAASVFGGEGDPAPAPAAGQSLSRDAAHRDTGDNAADFRAATPSPRAAGAP